MKESELIRIVVATPVVYVALFRAHQDLFGAHKLRLGVPMGVRHRRLRIIPS